MLSIVVTIMSIVIVPGFVYAQDVAGSSAAMSSATASARLVQNTDESIYARKKLAIRRVLEKYNSPMLGSVDDYIATCRKYDIDCYLLPAISGLESSFGNALMPGSYNPFGWGGGYIYFKNWGDGINTVGSGLKTNYIGKGANDLSSIGRIYSESPTWAVRVQIFINQFQAEEEKIGLFLDNSRVQL